MKFSKQKILDQTLKENDRLSDWEYTVSGENITLNYYIGYDTNIIIKSTYKIETKIYQTYLDKTVFKKCKNMITSVIVHDGVKINDCSFLFSYCSKLHTIRLDGSNMTKVKNMQYMFYNCLSLTSLNLSNWNTKNVNNMNGMFQSCSNLTTIYIGKNWKTAPSCLDMFSGCGTSTLTLKTSDTTTE